MRSLILVLSNHYTAWTGMRSSNREQCGPTITLCGTAWDHRTSNRVVQPLHLMDLHEIINRKKVIQLLHSVNLHKIIKPRTGFSSHCTVWACMRSSNVKQGGPNITLCGHAWHNQPYYKVVQLLHYANLHMIIKPRTRWSIYCIVWACMRPSNL